MLILKKQPTVILPDLGVKVNLVGKIRTRKGEFFASEGFIGKELKPI